MTTDKRRKYPFQITEKTGRGICRERRMAAVSRHVGVYQYQKKTVRKMILKDHKTSGRTCDRSDSSAGSRDRRSLRGSWSANVTRGQTLDCTVTTLAPLSEHRESTDWMRQRLQSICTTTISRLILLERQNQSRGPGRREIGHGHWQREHSFRYFQARQSSRMRFVRI